MEEFLSRDKGEIFDEFCTSGAVDMVFGRCIRWFVYSVNGSICAVAKRVEGPLRRVIT